MTLIMIKIKLSDERRFFLSNVLLFYSLVLGDLGLFYAYLALIALAVLPALIVIQGIFYLSCFFFLFILSLLSLPVSELIV